MSSLANLLLKWKSRTREYQDAQAYIQKVLALPFNEVKQQALNLIADSHRFHTIEAPPANNPAIERLGPVLREFFSRFESVRDMQGDFYVGRSAIGDSCLRPGFVKIGSDFESSELVVRPGEDRVFIVTDPEHRLDGLPTIYHNICLLA